MPLIRGMARTAVIAGTATAVSGRVARRQNEKWARQEEEQYAQQAPPQQYAAPAAPEAPAEDPVETLKRLGDLHTQGILTDEEFAAQKAKVLGSM